MLIGMSFSFKRDLFDNIKFSSYFEGYGLYEDADFSIRAQKYGKLVVHTGATLDHLHDHSGRPNTYKYGKMVLRNGWYVWRLKYPHPSLKAKSKFYLIHILLMSIRLLNVIDKPKKRDAFRDFLGRLAGFFSLIWNKPQIQR